MTWSDSRGGSYGEFASSLFRLIIILTCFYSSVYIFQHEQGVAMPCLGQTGLLCCSTISMSALEDRLCVSRSWTSTAHARHCNVFVFFLALLFTLVHELNYLLHQGHDAFIYEGIV